MTTSTHTLLLLSLVLLPFSGLLPTALAETPTSRRCEQAVERLRGGDQEGGTRALQEQLEQHPDDLECRLWLGIALVDDGRAEEAIQVLEAGLRGEDADFPLWIIVGEVRRQQGEDGPYVTRRRDSITAHPARGLDEAAWSKSRNEMALQAFRKAAELRPTVIRPRLAMAALHSALGHHTEAVQAYQDLTRAHPREPELWLKLARAHRTAGNPAEAASAAAKALSHDPRLAEAHLLLAEHHEAAGQVDEAASEKQQARFYAWLPPFFTLLYDPKLAATVEKLQERSPDKAKVVEALAAESSLSSVELLAALVWNHSDHGPVEDLAVQSLEQRGEQAVPYLLQLLKHAQTICTVRGAGHALARLKAPGALEALIDWLPRDSRPFFFADVAGALALLGDPRAVAALVQTLDPARQLPPAAEQEFMDPRRGLRMARARAALALGAFDTAEARAALHQGCKNPEVAPFCLAALYKLTRADEHLEALDRLMAGSEHEVPWMVVQYLESVQTPAARAFALKHRPEEKQTVP